jgi:EmrB/QacA subfamily drug resistance transporter
MPEIKTDSRKWWVLAAMGAILGVILLDETVVGVALPTIQRDLGMSDVAAHWVVNAYMLVLAGLAAAAGKFGDIVGHKTLMNTGLLIFALASLACGFADGDTWLIVARGVQGIGAAIIFPSSLAMLTIAFPEEQRGLAIGIAGAIGTVFLALGPLVGGFLTDIASWRWIFWVNPPIVFMVGLIVAAAWVEPAREAPPERIDKAGLVLLIGGLSMLIFAIMEGPQWGWTDPVILILLADGAVLLFVFVLVELRRRAPLMEVDLFANPTFTACNLVIFAAQFTKMAVFIFGALYLQNALEMSPLMAGIALLPTVAPQPLAAPLAGKAADRFGARWPSLGGLIFMLAGLAWISAAVSWQSYVALFPGLLFWGLSMAFLFVPPQRAVMNAVPPFKRGQAGGIAMSSQLLGATVGMAVSSTIFSMTGSFQAVFVTGAALTLVVLVIGWLAIERGSAVDNTRAPGSAK